MMTKRTTGARSWTSASRVPSRVPVAAPSSAPSWAHSTTWRRSRRGRKPPITAPGHLRLRLDAVRHARRAAPGRERRKRHRGFDPADQPTSALRPLGRSGDSAGPRRRHHAVRAADPALRYQRTQELLIHSEAVGGVSATSSGATRPHCHVTPVPHSRTITISLPSGLTSGRSPKWMAAPVLLPSSSEAAGSRCTARSPGRRQRLQRLRVCPNSTVGVVGDPAVPKCLRGQIAVITWARPYRACSARQSDNPRP